MDHDYLIIWWGRFNQKQTKTMIKNQFFKGEKKTPTFFLIPIITVYSFITSIIEFQGF